MVLPGPEAQQLATYIGWLMHRTWGGIVAGVLFVLPSLFILIALSWVYIAFGECRWWPGCSTASSRRSPPSCAGGAPHRLAGAEEQLLWAIAAAAFVAIFALNVPFPPSSLGAA
jgi:chromate transporter